MNFQLVLDIADDAFLLPVWLILITSSPPLSTSVFPSRMFIWKIDGS